MLYRIDYDQFLINMIDYFTLDELKGIQFLIIGTLPNRGLCTNITKAGVLYPVSETCENYMTYGDKEVMKKMYYDDLKECKEVIYTTIVENILNHVDIMIVCRKAENDYIDVFCEYLKEKFDVDCIDMNKLFAGETLDEIKLHGRKIRNNSIGIRRKAAEDAVKSLSSTASGRRKLMGMMSVKEKINRLKEVGIHVSKADIQNLDELLLEAWVEDDP